MRRVLAICQPHPKGVDMKHRMKLRFCLLACFMLCGLFHVSSIVSSATACKGRDCGNSETMKRLYAHTPHTPMGCVGPRRPHAKAWERVCARVSFHLVRGRRMVPSRRKIRRDARGNSCPIEHSLFQVSGFLARVRPGAQSVHGIEEPPASA